MVRLFKDERIDYLTADDSMQIIQSRHIFAFSLDAVLLAQFVYVPVQKGNILDLGTGNGAIPLLLSKRTNALITGVDIQERLVDMARRSVQLNQATDQLNIVHGDLKAMQNVLAQSMYDVVTCNPPYFKYTRETEHNANPFLTIARHEVQCSLEDVIRAAKLHVRSGGKVAMVHRPSRLVDIIILFRTYGIEPKRIRYVYPKQGKEANMLLIEGIRDGKSDCTVMEPLYIYHQDRTYTKEAGDIIHGTK